MSDALQRLAQLAGIEDGFWDFFGNWRLVSDDTRRAFLAAMGFDVGDDTGVERSLAALEERGWRRWLEPVVVAHEPDGPPEIVIALPVSREDEDIAWVLDEDVGIAHQGSFRGAELPQLGEHWLDGKHIRRRLFRLPTLPPPGYHRFRIETHDRAEFETTLIVAPGTAYTPEHIERGGRIWGVQTQIYALREDRDWGVGDYTALRDLAARAGRLGAGTVGVNPLHALFPRRPEKFSPYSASSRAFLNVAYLDVAAIPDFADCDAAKAMVADPAFQNRLAELRGHELIDYVGVAECKMPVLEAVYASFRERHVDSDRRHAFRHFMSETGRTGELFATFEALQEHFLRQDPHLGYWRHWPETYRRPEAPAVQAFALEHRDRVEFYWYLQWQADAQLAAVQSTCDNLGMPVGLYRDVGVGIADDGAEAWMNQDEMACGVTVGAPPDALAPQGQDWGLMPFNPLALREAAYRPFVNMLRANMRHAGALRLDHAMQLRRLYWVPPGASAEHGAYVGMPARDLFGIVALESRRNRCLVIGEDLGTVPEGFRELMYGSGVYGYRLFVFERDDAGNFRPPEQYVEQALVAVATHDLPSLFGYWQAIDLEARRRLHLYPRAGMDDEEARARDDDRRKLVETLRGHQLLPDDFPTAGPLSEDQACRLAEAVHVFLDRAPSKLMMVQMEDALGIAMQFNLPGTIDQHPNWRRRYPRDVTTMASHPRLVDTARRLKDTRVAPGQMPIVEV